MRAPLGYPSPWQQFLSQQSWGRWLLGLGALVVVAVYFWLNTGGSPPATPVEAYTQQVASLDKPTPLVAPAATPPATDPRVEELARQLEDFRRTQARQNALIEQLLNRKETPAKAAPVEKEKEKPKPPPRWSPVEVHLGKPPFAKPEPIVHKEPESQLISKAVQEIPERPELVLYKSQMVPGITLNEVKPNLPGPIHVQVARPVYDRFLQGNVLLPQNSIIIGEQLRVPEYGESQLAFGVSEIHFPDGRIVQLKGSLGDRSGAEGLKTFVDNRWLRVIGFSFVSAVLSMGARIPFGSPEEFYPSLGQQFSQQFGQSLNQAGQRIVNRELNALVFKPIKAGTSVTVHLDENISLAAAPLVVK